MANKDGTWLREISSCYCLTTAGKIRQLLLNKMYIPFLPSLYLGDLGGVGAEHPEGVVPESAGEDEAAVHRHHEARVAHAHALAEVVAQVAPDLKHSYMRRITMD